MPIKFRCPHCQQFLGISRAKAGLVTDCPTCGRTIRVPNLDGSIDPLPPPKFDLADAGLRNALNALASLEGGVSVVEAPPEKRPAVAVPARSSATTPPVELAPQPAPAPIVLSLAVEAPAPSAETPGPRANVGAALQELAATTASPEPIHVDRQPVSVVRGISGLVYSLSVLGSFLAGVGLGYSVWGLRGNPQANLPTPQTDGVNRGSAPVQAPVQPAQQPAVATPAPQQGLAGHLTYLNASGQSLNDAGARVLLLPEKLPGQSKLPVAGFRAGASEADRKLAEAAIAAIGGQLVIADRTGHYRLSAPPGQYHLLIMSRFSPRDEQTALIEDVRKLSAEFFDRPQLLVGQVNYHYQLLTLDSAGKVLNHQFPAP